jgi:hypothetical protein
MTGSGPAPRLMTEVTEPHAHRARRGSNWDLAGHDGAARRCTKRYRRAVRRLCRCGLDRDHDLGSGRGCYASIIHDPSSSVDAGPRHHRPASGHAPAASLARDPLGPKFGTGKFENHTVTVVTRRHTGRERAVPPWEEAPRSCVRQRETLSGPTHLVPSTHV